MGERRVINYLKGDATAPKREPGDHNIILAHICNDAGKWGAGFTAALDKRWSAPRESYMAWWSGRRSNKFGLGGIQMVKVENRLWVCNMLAQKGVRGPWNKIPIRYDALARCLEKLAIEADMIDADVVMPRIGCGLAGGVWEKIEPLILRELVDDTVRVSVYSLEENS